MKKLWHFWRCPEISFSIRQQKSNNVHRLKAAWCQTFEKGLSEIYAPLMGNICDIPQWEIHGHLPFTCNIHTLMCLHPILLSKSVTQFPPHDLFPLLLISGKLLFFWHNSHGKGKCWCGKPLHQPWQVPSDSACEAFALARLDGRWGNRLILVSMTCFLQPAGEYHYFTTAR